jgi:hypothetical protein
MRIRVKHDGSVLISAPLFMSRQEINRQIASRRSWIEIHKNKYQELYSFKSGKITEHLKIEVVSGSKKTIHTNKQKILIELPPGSSISKFEQYLLFRQILMDYLNQTANQELPNRLSTLANNLGFNYKNMNIRFMRSRWGSCNINNTITLNSQLMRLTPILQNYVVIHELVHTVHHHHKNTFWQHLEQHLPEYKALRHQLKNTLLLY